MGALPGWASRAPLPEAAGALAVAGFVVLTSRSQTPPNSGAHPVDPAGYLLVGLAAAGLVAARRRPVVALAVSAGAALLFVVLGYPYGSIFVTVMITMYALAAARPPAQALAAAGAVAAAHVPWSLYAEGRSEGLLAMAVTWAGWLGAPLGLGIAVRARRETRARAAEQERRARVYEERLRIAQEVHDVVGHSLAVISMNAGVALHVLRRQPQPPVPAVEAALVAIRQAGAGALEELRATLAAFTGRVAAPDRRPAPGLDALPDLVAATGSAGLVVTLQVDGSRGEVPAAVDLAGYRIAQEALANVVRHARARHAAVQVNYRPDDVELQVRDDGRGAGTASAGPAPAGSGLASMAERARVLGGTFSCGPRAGGGFEVRAVLPRVLA